MRRHQKDILYTADGVDGMGGMPQSNFQAIDLLFIDPAEEQAKRDIRVVPTARLNGVVLDPAGQPLLGVSAWGLDTRLSGRVKVLRESTFSIHGPAAKKHARSSFATMNEN